MSTVTIDYFIDRVGIDMRENYDWVDDSLERRYGTTQYNSAFQEYINMMEPLNVGELLVNDGYVSYTTPFFGLSYDFEMEAASDSTNSEYHQDVQENGGYDYGNHVDDNYHHEMSDRFYRILEYNSEEDIIMFGDIFRE